MIIYRHFLNDVKSLIIAREILGDCYVQKAAGNYADKSALNAHLIGKAMTKFEFERLRLDYEKITVGVHGKPIHGNIAFNVSHSKDAVVAAFSERENVSSLSLGVDVIDSHGRYSEIVVKKRFSIAENILVEQDKLNFAKIWAVKEAYLKAIGSGIAFGLNRIDTVSENGDFKISVDGNVQNDCDIGFLDVSEGLTCCLVVKYVKDKNRKIIVDGIQINDF